MYIFGSISIIMGLFLIGAFIALICSEKGNLKKFLTELLSYIISGVFCITFGILMMFKFTTWWRPFCILVLMFVLTIFIMVTTFKDKKGKKYIKYKTTGHGKNKHITIDDMNSTSEFDNDEKKSENQ